MVLDGRVGPLCFMTVSGSAVQGGPGRCPGDGVQLLQAVPVMNELLQCSWLSNRGAGGSERLD